MADETIKIELMTYVGTVDRAYVAATPPGLPDTEQTRDLAYISGAHAKRRLIGTLRREGDRRKVRVVKGPHLDSGDDYWFTTEDPEICLAAQARLVVRDAALVLDGLFKDWQRRIDPEILDLSLFSYCPLGQLYGSYVVGRDALEERLAALDTPREEHLRITEALHPTYFPCEKFDRKIIEDLLDLYWLHELQRRQ